jgi:hypothetical protein
MSRVNEEPEALPLFGSLSLMTLNINGMRTKIKKRE